MSCAYRSTKHAHRHTDGNTKLPTVPLSLPSAEDRLAIYTLQRTGTDRDLMVGTDRDLMGGTDRDLMAGPDRDLMADTDRDLMADTDRDLQDLTNTLTHISSGYGMKISSGKNKVLGIKDLVTIHDSTKCELQTVLL